MKNLKLYLESLLDDEDELALNDKELVYKFLNENYTFDDKEPGKPRKPRWSFKNGVVDVYGGSVRVKNKSITSLTNGLFKFGFVRHSFECSNCPNLESLEGAPEMIGGAFYCFKCPKLKSLIGGPKYMTDTDNMIRTYDIRRCKSLTSLEGAPIGNISGGLYGYNPKSCNIGRPKFSLDATDCSSIKTINWGIDALDGGLIMERCDLRDLKGSPKKISGFFNISYNKSLKSLKYGPSQVGKLITTGCDSLNDLNDKPIEGPIRI